MNILIVDDDVVAVEMLGRALTEAGHEVYIARDGAEALEVLHNHPVRIVVSDWLMPGVDGLELCRRIRSGGSAGYVYVILLTGNNRPEDVVEGLSAGADDFISKPFNAAELLVRLNAAQRIVSLETRHVTIFALARLAESRDPETGQHLERIREYSRILAGQLAAGNEFRGELSPEFVETIYLTSPLHDIGKVGIPDFILLKADSLTAGEFEVMKRHTVIGSDTLGAAAAQYPGVEYLRMATEIAGFHHERFNGTGYPEGLAGHRIPLCARIVGLADVYDALTSRRVYKEAMPHDVARNIVLDERGQHFDPVVVDAFLAIEGQFRDRVQRASHDRVAATVGA